MCISVLECGFGHLLSTCVDKKKTLDPSRVGVFGSYEPPSVDAGNYSPLKEWCTLLTLRHLSSPSFVYSLNFLLSSL